MRTTTSSPQTPESSSPEVRHWIADWCVTLLLLLFGTTTILQAYVVPTGSMTNTVLVGDHMLVDKLTYAPAGPLARRLLPYREVRRGDIIVFRYPLDIRQNYVKRAIGVPGDRIRFENKQLILNGRRVHEPYLRLDAASRSDYLDNFPHPRPDVRIETRGMQMLAAHVQGSELVVPPGAYFALGDNRDASSDSRIWGLVPRENIVGTPTMIFWSYDAPTDQLSGGFFNPRHVVDVAQHFFTRTRWERTFRLVRGYPLGE
jgi:signal peptidase I